MVTELVVDVTTEGVMLKQEQMLDKTLVVSTILVAAAMPNPPKLNVVGALVMVAEGFGPL